MKIIFNRGLQKLSNWCVWNIGNKFYKNWNQLKKNFSMSKVQNEYAEIIFFFKIDLIISVNLRKISVVFNEINGEKMMVNFWQASVCTGSRMTSTRQQSIGICVS